MMAKLQILSNKLSSMSMYVTNITASIASIQSGTMHLIAGGT